jgi:ligand-binding sensor domain-containing protein
VPGAFLSLGNVIMQIRILIIALAVFGVLVAACRGDMPDPSPSATPSGTIDVPSTTTVSTTTAPGWTRYVSINDVRDVTFDADGTLWAATGGGLIHWDLAEETYTRYLIQTTDVALTPDGTMWLASGGGVCLFDGAKCSSYGDAGAVGGSAVLSVAAAPGGGVWVGTETGVSHFDGREWKHHPFYSSVASLEVAPTGEVWAATARGVGRYAPSEDAWTFYTEEHGLPSAHAQVVAVSPQGDVWAYVLFEGLYSLRGDMWRAVDDAPGGRVADIAFAADGTPWVATAGGSHFPGGVLAYYDGHAWNEVTAGQELTSVTAVSLGTDGVVAVATDLGLGIYEGGEWRLLRDGPTRDTATSVAVTPDGAAWFGFGDHSVSTPGGGLSRFDGHDWQYHLDSAEVNALAVSPDGSLWVGAGCNVQRFDGVNWEAVALCGEYLLTGNVLDIDFTPNGSAWVATGFGLLNIGGERMAYERLINSVAVAPDGSIWANGWEGTQGSSYVARFDWQNWTTYRGADSYPGGFLVGAVTPDGLLWGTAPERRLVSFDGQSWADESAWRFHYNADGLPLGDFTALSVAPDGALWVGLEGGVACFDGVWTTFVPEGELAAAPVRAIAFGPEGGVWLGTTHLDENLATGTVYP